MSSPSENPSEDSDSKDKSAARLRALLEDIELTPEQTGDDMAPQINRDREFLEDVPPHHG